MHDLIAYLIFQLLKESQLPLVEEVHFQELVLFVISIGFSQMDLQ